MLYNLLSCNIGISVEKDYQENKRCSSKLISLRRQDLATGSKQLYRFSISDWNKTDRQLFLFEGYFVYSHFFLIKLKYRFKGFVI